MTQQDSRQDPLEVDHYCAEHSDEAVELQLALLDDHHVPELTQSHQWTQLLHQGVVLGLQVEELGEAQQEVQKEWGVEEVSLSGSVCEHHQDVHDVETELALKELPESMQRYWRYSFENAGFFTILKTAITEISSPTLSVWGTRRMLATKKYPFRRVSIG